MKRLIMAILVGVLLLCLPMEAVAYEVGLQAMVGEVIVTLDGEQLLVELSEVTYDASSGERLTLSYKDGNTTIRFTFTLDKGMRFFSENDFSGSFPVRPNNPDKSDGIYLSYMDFGESDMKLTYFLDYHGDNTYKIYGKVDAGSTYSSNFGIPVTEKAVNPGLSFPPHSRSTQALSTWRLRSLRLRPRLRPWRTPRKNSIL